MNNVAYPIASFLNPLGYPYSLNDIEGILESTDHIPGSFSSIVEEILASPFWQSVDYQDNPYKSLCLNLAKEIDALYSRNLEPAYHSRLHFKDVCLMLSFLLMHEEFSKSNEITKNDWSTSREEKWLLLLAAIGHDFGHPGMINQTPFEIEKKSLALLEVFLSQSKLNTNFIDAIGQRLKPWILATDPLAYDALLSEITGAEASHEDCLAMLLIEADLFASILPMKGQLLGARLAEEWKSANPAKAAAVISKPGRIAFLKSLRFISPHAQVLGAEQIRLNSIQALDDLKY